MNDLELTRRTAEKCGLDYWVTLDVEQVIMYRDDNYQFHKFNPLYDMNDLMRIVVPKLLKKERIWVYIGEDRFAINDHDCPVNEAIRGGSYPADYARAVCECLVEAEE
jgi:hypothetical protein